MRRIALSLLLCAVLAPARGADLSSEGLKVLSRVIRQDGGTWKVYYVIRYDGVPVDIRDDPIPFELHGDVSNSRVPFHSRPATIDLVSSWWYRDRDNVLIAKGDEWVLPTRNECKFLASARLDCGRHDSKLIPGDVLKVSVDLVHRHAPYGNYDPLLGIFRLDITFGTTKLHDILRLDHEDYKAYPRLPSGALAPSYVEGNYSSAYYVSPPESFYASAHISRYARFTTRDIPVRGSTVMCLRFWYLIARNSGHCDVIIKQYSDIPNSYFALESAGVRRELNTVGHWTYCTVKFRVPAEATCIDLSFGFPYEVDVGEMWIDDIELIPGGRPAAELRP
jgi:hypothetical protein